MIGAICDIWRHHTIRTNYFNIIHDPKIVTDRLSQAGERREVEQTNHLMRSDINFQYEEHTTTRNVFEDGNLVVERYDKNGKLIRMTPPSYIPFDQITYSILI
jgi:hypothetical protein